MKLFNGWWSPLDISGSRKETVVDPKPDTSMWSQVTELKDFPNPDDLTKYGTWSDLIHLLKVLYTKNLEMAKQNENRDPS